jgi:hypothetical protein
MQLQEFINKAPGTLYLSNHNYLMERLVNKLTQLKSIALSAHRGWGKSDLIKELGFRLINEKQDFRVLYFDMRGIFEKSAFIRSLVVESCKTISSDTPDQIVNASLPGFEMLDHIESIAQKQAVKLIVFLSNVEQIGKFKLDFKQLRLLQLILLKQENCAYCFSSSNQVTIYRLFGRAYSPMNRMARVYYLKRPHIQYSQYVRGLFFHNGKGIEHSAVNRILDFTENHLHYIRLLSWHAYLSSSGRCTIQDVEYAFLNLIKVFELHIQKQLTGLTSKQLSFLCALAEEQEKLCSGKILDSYKLRSSSNVARIKENLLAKELIEVQRKQVSIIDPLLKHYILEQIRSRK